MPTQALLIDAKQGADLLGVCERSYHNLRKRPDFPKPVAKLLGPRVVRWRRSDLEAFVNGLPAASAALQEPKQLRQGRVYRSGQLVSGGA